MNSVDVERGDPSDERPSPGMMALVLAVVGVLMLATGAFRLWSGLGSSAWPTAEGTVLESRLEVVSDAETTTTTAHIRYEYVVDGTRWVSSRIWLAQPSLDLSGWSRRMVQTHPAGAAVSVHYRPDAPWESALVVGAGPAAYAQPVAGAALLAIAAVTPGRARLRARPAPARWELRRPLHPRRALR